MERATSSNQIGIAHCQESEPMSPIIPAVDHTVDGKIDAPQSEFGVWLTSAMCLMTVAAIGVFDVATGWGVSTVALYGFPVFLAAFRVGSRFGILVAFICAVVWAFANFGVHGLGSTPAFVWAAFSRLIVFLFVALGGSALRNHRLSTFKYLASEARADELERHLLRIIEEERRRLNDEVNANVNPVLHDMVSSIKTIRARMDNCSAETARLHSHLLECVENLQNYFEDNSLGLTEAASLDEGFARKMEKLAEHWSRTTGVDVKFSGSALAAVLSSNTANHLIRIAYESVRNAARYGKAHVVAIAITSNDDELILRIEDDGDSFQLSPHVSCLGVMTLHARQANAELTSQRLVPHGTEVLCRVKVGREHDWLAGMDGGAATAAIQEEIGSGKAFRPT